ncbi:hypothetical protein [Streptomyces sp. NPDC127112]|uniref:hypothetical protein n=1 Tax=Streptomyces sp. NPDC127112 TaxID=3345364 RepID=UPI003639D7F0
MHDRPRLEEAIDVLRAELDVGRSTKTELTTRAAWLAFMRFARQRFATAPTPDSDGLLFQYGTYAFSGRPMFTVDLTRQFDVSDDEGEHTNGDLDEWFAAMERHLELLLARRPAEIRYRSSRQQDSLA